MSFSVTAAPVPSQQQHGFIPRRSFSTNLCAYLKHAWEVLSEKYQIDTIYTEYSSAFQNVNHTLINYKVEHSHHLKGFALQWFTSLRASAKRERVLCGLLEKSQYERPGTARHGPARPDPTPRCSLRAYISATAGPIDERSSLVDSNIPSALNGTNPEPSG